MVERSRNLEDMDSSTGSSYMWSDLARSGHSLCTLLGQERQEPAHEEEVPELLAAVEVLTLGCLEKSEELDRTCTQ